MCVEASPNGKHLYEQYGFRTVKLVEIPVPQKWADKPKIEYEFMRRPVAGKASQQA